MKILSLLLFDMLFQPILIKQSAASFRASRSPSFEYNIVVHNKSSYTLLMSIGNWPCKPTLQKQLYTIKPGEQLQETVDMKMRPELLVIYAKDSDVDQSSQLLVERAYLYQLNIYRPSISLGALDGRKLVLKAIDSDSAARFVLVPKRNKFSFFAHKLKRWFTLDELICKVLSPHLLNLLEEQTIPNFELKNQTGGVLTLTQCSSGDKHSIHTIPPNYYFQMYIPPQELGTTMLILSLWFPDNTSNIYQLSFRALTEQSTVYIAAVQDQSASGYHAITLVPYQNLNTAYTYESDRLLDYNITTDALVLSSFHDV